MNRQTRLGLEDTLMSSIVKLSDGNPGAASACVELAKVAAAVDPDSAWEAAGPLIALDTHGIYGSRIWMLYKDVCGQDPVKVIAVLRAVQLGLLPEQKMLSVVDGARGQNELDIDSILASVQERLPRFAGKAPESPKKAEAL